MRDVYICPVAACGWEYSLPPDDGSVSYARSLTAVSVSHAESHPVTDYLAAIRDLQRQLTAATADRWVM